MTPAHLARQLGPEVHAEPIAAVLRDGLHEALGAARTRSGGRPVVLVLPSPGGPQDALYVVEAARLPDLLASSLAAQAGIVHRVRRTLRRMTDADVPRAEGPTDRSGPATVPEGDGGSGDSWAF